MANVSAPATMVADTTGGTSLTTTSYTPAAGDLLVLIASTSSVAQLPAVWTITNSVAGVPNFDLAATALYSAGGDPIGIWVGCALQSPGVARTTTVTFGGGTAGGTFWGVYAVSGMRRTGRGAIRQVAIQNSTAAATPAPVFPNACLTQNPIIGVVANVTNPAALTPPTGFTETFDGGYATPTVGYEVCFSKAGITVTTLTWGGASPSNFGAIGLELDTAEITASDVSAVELASGGALN